MDRGTQPNHLMESLACSCPNGGFPVYLVSVRLCHFRLQHSSSVNQSSPIVLVFFSIYFVKAMSTFPAYRSKNRNILLTKLQLSFDGQNRQNVLHTKLNCTKSSAFIAVHFVKGETRSEKYAKNAFFIFIIIFLLTINCSNGLRINVFLLIMCMRTLFATEALWHKW